MRHAARRARTPSDAEGILLDKAGLPVDARGGVWVLNDATRPLELRWDAFEVMSPQTLVATRRYVAGLVETRAPQSVANAFNALRDLRRSPSFVAAERDGTEIPEAIFGELRVAFGTNRWKLHYVRHWYRSCVDLGNPAFSAEVAFALDERRIGGNRKGHAVLSLDPEAGPLDDLETVALLNALTNSTRTDRASKQGNAALWLCIALGCNPSQLALLREEDVESVAIDGQRLVLIRVPRVKKRLERPRAEFRTRKLVAEIGNVVLDLIDDNRFRRLAWDDDGSRYGRPLFERGTPRPYVEGDPMEEYALHLYSHEFTALVAAAVDDLGVTSPRTGKPLKISTRRLRYTYATRLVREGASLRAVADALDHSDLQNVRCYFDVRSDIVDSLDAAMALALGPRAQAFLGKLVDGEGDAARGDDPTSRIAVQDKSNGEARAVGNCGSFSFCGLYAPIACYTCSSFQPWMDGPHEVILQDLVAQRERRAAAGQDGRMVAMHDTTILAIADVIHRIEHVRTRNER